MPDNFQGNHQPLLWTATKAGVLCDVASGVLLVRGGVQFCRLLEANCDFFVDNERQHIFKLIVELQNKNSKNIMFTFRKRTTKYLKMQQLYKKQK